ncbi:MAG TPA: Rieske 2Fe-2S domain-containing protein [Nocardioidaceae bacterium]|nr:Rieske 2Fe-2S domain-containing protein [Nocardioidaceae bacterium]
MEHPVGTVEEIRGEGRRLVEVAGRPVAVLAVGERFFAVHDRCPHRGASLCEGTVGGTFIASAPQEFVYGRHDRVLRCPWHGWEFDLDTGRSLMTPTRVGIRTYPVSVRDGTVMVHA